MRARIHQRLLAGTIATGLVASALVAGGGVAGAATNPEKVLSHFLCWAGMFLPFDGPIVGLQDRFGAYDADVEGADLMCNPARKKRGDRITPIVSERQHLKHYDIDTDPAAPVDILVTNQFGRDQRVIIQGNPSGLLVPTRKFPHKAPRGLDHFACHIVMNNLDINKRVQLRDQFKRFRTTVVEELFHCLPTRKVHGTRVVEVRHPGAHLACYSIAPRSLDSPKSRRTKNQFEEAKITGVEALFLCVPSRTRLTPVP